MRREDHILWKIANAYAVIYELQVRRQRGQIDPHQYAALIQPVCIEVMNKLFALIEQGGFISKAREVAKLFNRKSWDEPGGHRKYSKEYNQKQTEYFNADWIVREYEKFVQRYRHAIFEPNPVERATELVMGMDSLVGWMHGCCWISKHVMHISPITGVFDDDYNIATHTMYLLAEKGIDETMDYLRMVIPAEF